MGMARDHNDDTKQGQRSWRLAILSALIITLSGVYCVVRDGDRDAELMAECLQTGNSPAECHLAVDNFGH